MEIHKHNRASIRMKGFDYSMPGFYYVTLCTQDRENRFGMIANGEMVLNSAGKMVEAEWNRIQERYGHVIIDTYQIMPNHLHGILQISASDKNEKKSYHDGLVGTGLVPVQDFLDESTNNGRSETSINIDASTGMGTRPIPTVLFDVIGTFKSLTQNDYAFQVRKNGWPSFRKRLWQLRFYDHIIRNQGELDRIRGYIIDNPKNWMEDENNLESISKLGTIVRGNV
jgi:putative transposase